MVDFGGKLLDLHFTFNHLEVFNHRHSREQMVSPKLELEPSIMTWVREAASSKLTRPPRLRECGGKKSLGTRRKSSSVKVP